MSIILLDISIILIGRDLYYIYMKLHVLRITCLLEVYLCAVKEGLKFAVKKHLIVVGLVRITSVLQ